MWWWVGEGGGAILIFCSVFFVFVSTIVFYAEEVSSFGENNGVLLSPLTLISGIYHHQALSAVCVRPTKYKTG